MAPIDYRGYEWLGATYRHLGEKGEAIQAYHRVIELGHVSGYISIGDIYRYDERDYAEAERWYARALAAFPDSADPYLYLGINALSQNQYQMAFTFLQEALRIDPNKAMTRRYLGEWYLRQGDPEKAARELSEAAHLGPDQLWTFILLGDAYFEMGNYTQAYGAYRRALEISPQDGYTLERVERLMAVYPAENSR